jgi:hypothetical protein
MRKQHIALNVPISFVSQFTFFLGEGRWLAVASVFVLTYRTLFCEDLFSLCS